MELKMIGNGFVAEISGIDCASIQDKDVKFIKDLLYQYQVIVIRNQYINYSDQINFSKKLGTLREAWDKKNRHPQNRYVQVITNTKIKNFVPTHKGATLHWHSDGSFLSQPIAITFLRSECIAKDGGDTLFTNLYMAYDSLPRALKGKIQDLNAVHSFQYLHAPLRQQGALLSGIVESPDEIFPEVKHPIVRYHPVTKKPALYLGELYLKNIDGFEQKKSDDLLKILYEHALNPEFQYAHSWHRGDLLVWDNASIMHRGMGAHPKYPRTLHQTTVI